MKSLLISNVGFAPLAIRIVKKGDPYGKDGCLINKGSPMIEFYDRRYNIDKWLNPDIEGQFIARYYVSSFLEAKSIFLDLDTGISSWKLSEVKAVQEWVKQEMAQ